MFHIFRIMLFKSQNALWNTVPFWHVIMYFLPQWPLCHKVLVLVSFAVYLFCQSWTFLSIKEEHSDWWCEVFQVSEISSGLQISLRHPKTASSGGPVSPWRTIYWLSLNQDEATTVSEGSIADLVIICIKIFTIFIKKFTIFW